MSNRFPALIAKRVALGFLTVICVSIVVFGASELLPGDLATAVLGQSATPEALAALREELHLNLPAYQRYLQWLSGLMHADLGMSLANRLPVQELIAARLKNTFILAVYAAVLSVPLSIALGILASLFRNSIFDKALNSVALVAISIPDFFMAYILIFLLAQSGYFPSMSRISDGAGIREIMFNLFLPALALTLIVMAYMMRMTRAAIVNVLSAPFIEMARLKGMPRWRVVIVHALPNALAPIINVVAVNLAFLITGVVVVEVVFVYPGLGQLMVDSVSKRDMPVVQAVTLIFATAYVGLNTLADVLSILSNPRSVERSR